MLRFAISPLGDGEYEADRISDQPNTLEDATREVAETVAEGVPVIAIVHVKGGAVELDEARIEEIYEAANPLINLSRFDYDFLSLLVEEGFKAGRNHVLRKLGELLSDD